MSSMEVNIDLLEQMDLMDVSDQEALDVFLNSGGEDNTVLSPVLGRGTNVHKFNHSYYFPSQSKRQSIVSHHDVQISELRHLLLH